MHAEWTNDRFTVSTDRARLDIGVIHSFLSELCFGLFDEAAQVGFARVVTDYAIFAYLCDVFVIESHRGCGLSKWLLRCVLSHPAMTGIRRFHLLTNDAHTLYQQLGFTALASPERHMELVALSPAPDPKR